MCVCVSCASVSVRTSCRTYMFEPEGQIWSSLVNSEITKEMGEVPYCSAVVYTEWLLCA